MSEPTSLSIAPAGPAALLFGLGLKKKALFFRQVATMVNAGMSIGRALVGGAPHTVGQVGVDMAHQVEQGFPLSAVMRRYPYYFSDFESSMIQAGEQGGSLERRLSDLADYLERSHTLQQEITSRMIYPALVLHVGIFAPPLYLLVTSGPEKYLQTVLAVVLPLYVALLAFALVYRIGSNVPGLRSLMDTVALFTPVMGGVVKNLALSRYLHMLSQLYEAGILPINAMALAARSCGNSYLGARLMSLVPQVDAGTSPGHAMSSLGVFPPTLMQLIATGEETGDMAAMLARTANLMEEEARFSITRFMTILPILILIVLGVVVGFIVVKFYTSTMSQFLDL